MAITRSELARKAGSSTDSKMNDNIDATVPSKAAMEQAMGSRFALGDIGNIGAKVSSLTLDPLKKNGAIKKEILGQQPAITRQKTITRRALAQAVTMAPPAAPAVTAATSLSSLSTSVKATALKTEVYCDFKKRLFVRHHYLDGADITGKMRSILVDWLCQVHHRFHLLQETLYLTVAIIDRYLQEKPVIRNKLQLVGVTAMLLASKYEEMFAPEVADFVYITDNAYSKADIREMERDILRTLNFSFGKPLCLHFLRRNSKAGQVDATKHTLAKYMMELTITEYDMVHLPPSQIAAAALYLSIKLLDNSPWTETLAYYSTYSEDHLQPLATKLAGLVHKAETSKLTAIRTKYSTSKLMKISQIPELKSPLITELAGQAS
ncbi:hypothetical protein V1264_002371 [Littorina saxatilis]|uniref:Cyclin B n=1 Tax=Littorina saxatilis TaxID=31220 RepID=A0AAN9C3X0_9CAEN